MKNRKQYLIQKQRVIRNIDKVISYAERRDPDAEPKHNQIYNKTQVKLSEMGEGYSDHFQTMYFSKNYRGLIRNLKKMRSDINNRTGVINKLNKIINYAERRDPEKEFTQKERNRMEGILKIQLYELRGQHPDHLLYKHLFESKNFGKLLSYSKKMRKEIIATIK